MERKSRASVLGPPVFQYTSLYVRISEAKNLPNKDMYVIKQKQTWQTIVSRGIAAYCARIVNGRR